MNKFIYCLATVLVLGTTVAFAEPGGSACDKFPDAPFCGGGSNDEGSNINDNTQSQQQSSASQSGAVGVGVGVGEGGSARQSQNQSTRSDSSSESVSGAVASSGGNTTGDISIEGDTFTNRSEHTAASAASVFAEQCQTGMSGQLEDGGFSVINSDQFCDYIKAAQLAQTAYLWELDHGSAECSEPMADGWVDGGYSDTCVNEKAQKYLADYRQNVDHALALVDYTEPMGWMDRIAGQLIRPIAVVAMLIFLI